MADRRCLASLPRQRQGERPHIPSAQTNAVQRLGRLAAPILKRIGGAKAEKNQAFLSAISGERSEASHRPVLTATSPTLTRSGV